jgi:hypothetical protein
MRSKFVLTIAAGLLAGTAIAAAQQSGAPAGEKDRTGQPTDSGATSTDPNRPAGTQGQGSGTMSPGAPVQRPPAASEPLPGEPTRGATPRQGEASGDDAVPKRK